MNDHTHFLRAILGGSFETALPYSDWLQEQGDSRALLLRTRYKWMATYLKNAAMRNAKRKAHAADCPSLAADPHHDRPSLAVPNHEHSSLTDESGKSNNSNWGNSPVEPRGVP